MGSCKKCMECDFCKKLLKFNKKNLMSKHTFYFIIENIIFDIYIAIFFEWIFFLYYLYFYLLSILLNRFLLDSL